MKNSWITVILLSVMTSGFSLLHAQSPADKTVVRLDPALDELISPDTEVQKVKGGLGFTEGITWVQKGNSGYVIFSDMWANQIYKVTPDGQMTLFLDHSGYEGFDIWRQGMPSPEQGPNEDKWYNIGSNGLALDRQGHVLIATSTGRSIVRLEKNGKRTVIADHYDGKKFNGPNDIIVKRDGAIYFTDGFGGLRAGAKDPLKETDLRAVFMIKGGKVSVAIGDMPAYNGLAFSPDEKYLYANASQRDFVRRYDVQPDDTLTNGKMFFDMSDVKGPGITDGMKVDSKGDVWETGPGPAIWILSPEGKHLGSVRLPEVCPNLTFGDSDRKTIYVAGHTAIYKIKVNVPGIK
jgi:gluconolactonase